MNDVAVVLGRLSGLGVHITVDGPDLVLQPSRLVPADVVPILRAHKPEIIRLLTGREALSRALLQKLAELGARHADLESPHYKDDPWCLEQACILQRQIGNIRAHLEGTESLDLPQCCRAPQLFCLAATKGFQQCVFNPQQCGFSY
ncbi:MAG: hypothetical protein SVP26_11065 [Chloroflexota bacterium]|nr:hypothetical protein [Chloroflexota bacterium]